VPQDVEAVLAGDLDRLDLVAVGDGVREVLELTGDAGGDDGAVDLEELTGGRTRRDHALFPLIGIAFDDHTDV
jgi:hypothetical protein